MKKIKTVCSLFLCAVLAAALSGCSITDAITGNTTEESESTTLVNTEDLKNVDKSLALPQFQKELEGYVPIVIDSEYYLDATAVSPDGGEITYQWYVNNVDSNGGGTKIAGATDATYRVPSDELGIRFYYVVAVNNHGNSFNTVTSNVSKVEVNKIGEWTVDEFGGIRYLSDDGTYPANRWMYIGDGSYRFQENGYRVTGWWYEGGQYIYFDAEGKALVNGMTPEGFHTNERGVLIEDADPLGYLQAEAEAQAAAAAEAQAAAEAEAAAAAEAQAAAEAEAAAVAEAQAAAEAEAAAAAETP